MASVVEPGVATKATAGAGHTLTHPEQSTNREPLLRPSQAHPPLCSHARSLNLVRQMRAPLSV